MIRIIFLTCIFSLHAACSSETFLGAADSRADKKESEDEDLQANEPVPIGGAFLNCQLFETEQNQLKCRIEEEAKKKPVGTTLRASDLIAYDDNMQIMPKDFILAPADSQWHWMSKKDESLDAIYMLGLANRFESDVGKSNTTTMMPELVKILEEKIPEDFDLVPGTDQMTQVADDSFIALGITWIHGASGESCTEACGEIGEAFLEPMQKWTKKLNFCQSAFNTLYLGKLGATGLSLGVPGFGCYTLDQFPNAIAINDTSVERGVDQSMPGVRQFCACKPN